MLFIICNRLQGYLTIPQNEVMITGQPHISTAHLHIQGTVLGWGSKGAPEQHQRLQRQNVLIFINVN